MEFNTLPSNEIMEKTSAALREHGFNAIQVNSKEEALAKVRELIPEGVSIMNGTSMTLKEIGYIDLLKSGNHKWNNLHDAILAETDPQKQELLE